MGCDAPVAAANAVLVLNAGSSSLKFSVYRIGGDDKLAPVARGQVEGLGTAPHFKAKDARGAVLADAAVETADADPRDGHVAAFDHLVRWAGQTFGETLAPAATIGRAPNNSTNPTAAAGTNT